MLPRAQHAAASDHLQYLQAGSPWMCMYMGALVFQSCQHLANKTNSKEQERHENKRVKGQARVSPVLNGNGRSFTLFTARGLRPEPEEHTKGCFQTSLYQCFKPLFYGGTPKIILHNPMKPHLCKCSHLGKLSGCF